MNWIELTASDGHRLQAWCARPDGQARGAVVVLQEIFGVNKHIRAVCDRLAEQGWLAVAPALFDRAETQQALAYDAAAVARGRELQGRVGNDAALLDVQAALDWSAAQPGVAGRVAVLGFCWGGTLTWLAAARLQGIGAAIAYYGTNIAAHLQERPRVPVLLHFGEQDPHIPPQHVADIERAYPDIALHRYPAGHGFNCDDRAAFHADSAALAGARTLAFLKEVFPC